MTTREQDNHIDRLALKHGRVSIRDGFMDKSVLATIPTGREVRLNEDGIEVWTGYNSSIRWNEEQA